MERGKSTALVLRMVGLAESTYYARKKRLAELPAEQVSKDGRGRPVPGFSLSSMNEKVEDEHIKGWILELLDGEEHVYGYRLLGKRVCQQHDVKLNGKKSYRLCKELGILQQARKRVSKHPRRLPRNHTITRPNQLWQMDIKYAYVLGKERFVYVFTILDVFDRVAVQQYRGTVCGAVQIVQTLSRALESRVKPGEALPVIRSDNGPQFVSKLFGDTCESLGLVHERIPPRTPDMNAYIESFHSLLERDLFHNRDFMTLEEAYEAIDQYLDFYNHRRMHGRLKDMAPMEFSSWVMTLEDSSQFHRSL
jgi:putative transposase